MIHPRKGTHNNKWFSILKNYGVKFLSLTDVAAIDTGFEVSKSLIITWDQILRKKAANFKALHRLLFHSPVFRSFILASGFYHDQLWYPLIGRRKMTRFAATEWGKLYESYQYGEMPEYTEPKEWSRY